MKNKILINLKSLAKSTINTKELFERRKNSFFIPLVIYFLIVALLCVPTYLFSINTKSETIVKKFPQIQQPMEKLLTSNLACTVKDSILVCDENAQAINMVVGEEIKYTIIANQDSISLDTTVENKSKDTDNLIILFKNIIKIRYIEHDYANDQTISYEIIGDYSKLEGYDFKKVSEKLTSNPSLAEEEINSFIYNAYLSTLDTQLITNLANALISFTLLLVVTCVILKGPFLFKIKKGLKIGECAKISLTATLPALVISLLLYLLIGADFASILGLIYIIRIMYIYFRYIFPRNNIFKELYAQTQEERFNV